MFLTRFLRETFIIAKTGRVQKVLQKKNRKKERKKLFVFEGRILTSLSVKLSAIKWCRE